MPLRLLPLARLFVSFIKVEASGEERTLHPAGGGPGTMQVKLTNSETSASISANPTNVIKSPTRGFYDLALQVSLNVFHLDPPVAMASLVRVKDTVEVRAHVVLKKESAK